MDGEDFQIFGKNIWSYHWEILERNNEVIDPIYKNKYYFDKYEIDLENDKFHFVAGEFSNMIWGFYVKDLSLLNEVPLRT